MGMVCWGKRTALRAHDREMAAIERDGSRFAGIENGADDVDRLIQRFDLVERFGRSEGQLGAPAAEQIETGDLAADDGWHAPVQPGDQRPEPDALGLPGDPGEGGPRIEQRALGCGRVVVPQHDEVIPERFAEPRELDRLLRIGRAGGEQGSEDEIVTVIGHRADSMVDTSTSMAANG